MKYRICAVADVLARQKYIDNMKKKSMYSTGQNVLISDKIVTLSTCTTWFTRRLIVQGIRVDENQTAPHSAATSRENLVE